MNTQPSILDCASQKMQMLHLSQSTRQCYLDWIYRFICFHNKRPPVEMGEKEVKNFLVFLAGERKASLPTQHQARQALIFLYQKVLDQPLEKDSLNPIPKPKRLPVILTRQQVWESLAQLKGETWLMASLLYGCGLQLNECLTLQMEDTNPDKGIIRITNETGLTDRTLNMPDLLSHPLSDWKKLQTAKLEAFNSFQNISHHSSPSYPLSCMNPETQYLFPASKPTFDTVNGNWKFCHRSEGYLQKAVKKAFMKAGICKTASCYSFRHSFAAHLLEDGYDIRMVQKLLGHNDVRTTMVYAHLIKQNPANVKSPLDSLKKDH